jgi:hypothetical protein
MDSANGLVCGSILLAVANGSYKDDVDDDEDASTETAAAELDVVNKAVLEEMVLGMDCCL